MTATEGAPPLHLDVSPAFGLVDVPLRIHGSGVGPKGIVRVSARLLGDDGATWSSEATFSADLDGNLDLAAQAPVAGSYEGVESMGLVWSMRADSVDARNPFLFRRRLDPLTITFEASVMGGGRAEAVARRASVSADVQRTDVREMGLVATFFQPADGRPAPIVLVFGGSGGGLSDASAALLASHGFAALSLAYFAMPGLPEDLALIPLEYFEAAIDWLAGCPNADTGRLAVMGTSRGGELALLLGATFPRVRAVVAYAPSALVYGSIRRTAGRGIDSAWTYHGEPVPWFRPTHPPAAGAPAPRPSGEPFALTPGFIAGLSDEAAVGRALIPVERIRGPVLLISGRDDEMWPSWRYGEMVMERLSRNAHPYRDEHLSYPDCGHLVGFPYVPTTVTSSVHPVTRDLFAFGGTPPGQARARERSWPRVLRFLRESLL
ncbi:MAG: hypothetical protein EXR61_02875 [Chloroflexi bacterium]|nr:hypothetical protein [Chloroflexota bacterium]